MEVYRRLTRLYPRSFRQNYGTDLVALFADQIQDEPTARVWLRAVRDLSVTVPTQRLEAHMQHSSARVLTAVSGVVAASATVLALTLGSGPAMPIFLVVALVAGAVAVWSWQSAQPVRADMGAAGSWWKVLLAGPVLAALTFGAMAVPWPEAMDLGDNAYWLVLIAFMTSLTLTAFGVLLGFLAAVGHRRTRRMGTSPA